MGYKQQEMIVLCMWMQSRRINEFKAKGNVWHQSDGKQDHIPEKLRNLDTDATWSKSGYHGWVYGYSLHRTSTQAGFPVLLEVETATFSEKAIMAIKEETSLHHLKPETFCGDDAYTQTLRIRPSKGRLHE